MKQYTVTSDEPVTLPDGSTAGKDAVVELDETTIETEALVAAGKVVAIDAPAQEEETVEETPPADSDKANPFFALDVKYREGTTEGEIEAASAFVVEFNAELAASNEDHFPLCIDALTIRRIR